jgi:hypothetical protein
MSDMAGQFGQWVGPPPAVVATGISKSLYELRGPRTCTTRWKNSQFQNESHRKDGIDMHSMGWMMDGASNHAACGIRSRSMTATSTSWHITVW